MKFGIFHELQLPGSWSTDSEWQLYHDALTQLELADQLGYDDAWEVEHHFREEYSHSPAPEVFLGAASQRTGNIRLGHGVLQLIPGHPSRVAGRVSVLESGRPHTHLDITASLELFAREVMSEFHAMIPEHEAWKAKVMAREIDLEKIDTEQFTRRFGAKSVRV